MEQDVAHELADVLREGSMSVLLVNRSLSTTGLLKQFALDEKLFSVLQLPAATMAFHQLGAAS